MKKEFQEFFRPFTFLTPKDMIEFMRLAKIVRCKKGTVLLEAGKVDNTLYSLLRGYTRTYVVRDDGEEITTYLAGPGMTVGSYRSNYKDQPSNETVVVVEDAIMLSMDFMKLRELTNNNDNVNRLYITILEKNFMETVERIEFHSAMTAEQRYVHLLQQRADLIKHVPQKYIASYIGITAVSLSRIRARVVNNNP